MNENMMEQEELLIADEAAEDIPEPAEEITLETAAEYDEMKAALLEARIKLALLLCGAAKEKLEEGSMLAHGFCIAGMEPEDAAQRVMEEYPHLRLISREVPKFAAQGGGSGDGFAAIRNIFARR